MSIPIYNPFERFTFDSRICFLTGVVLQPDTACDVSVFPEWLMDEFGLREKPIQMLDERVVSYQDLKLPCSPVVQNAIRALDQKVAAAFSLGYEGLRTLDELTLFQWIGKFVYGMIFCEIQAGIRQQALAGEPLNFSQVLAHKFRYFHAMLQSIVLPMEFEGALPFSIQLFHVNNPAAYFNYRDEINTLAFSLRMRDFGIIANLQDNGTNAIYHEEDLILVQGSVLHPIQFEELCGKFFYSAYLFNRLPEYSILPTADCIYIEPMSLRDGRAKPLFDAWQAKTYGQVLENFWKPWGFTLFEIVKNPDQPMSFLRDEMGNFADASSDLLAGLSLGVS